MASRSRWRGRALLACAALLLGAGVGVLAGWPVAWPFDVLINLGAVPEYSELRAPADGTVRVVVLQHGLWRTAASLGRLERTLQAHGYEVLNPGYPSTNASLEAHAERLAGAIAARVAAGPVDAFAFVGHSMGGVVIQQYLRRADAVAPWACVYLGTPHRGAVLADLRKHWFLFQWAMGELAATQLSPGDPFHRQPIPCGACSGTIVGELPDDNPSIPGKDDGTVAVGEATFPEAAATVTLPFGHTRLTFAEPVLEAVLHYLRRGTFPPPRDAR
jgi:triacylglycerol lipase